MSRSDSVIFDESLIEAKLKLQKALSLYTSGYFGDEDMLKIANTNSELANTILIGMKAINSRSKD